MEFSETTIALCKLLAVCATLMALLRLHLPLWLTICGGCLEVAVFSGIGPASWPGIVAGVLTNADFLLLCLMIFLIMFLSSIQDATGQSRKLVTGLERHLRHPRIRLVLFPALVGLLPMPGGALFSCPMIRAATEGMEISERRKALVNYWFRHIWEASWPLYPGYALICALLQIPLSLYWRYTFPLVFMALAIGWLFFLRDLDASKTAGHEAGASPSRREDMPSAGESDRPGTDAAGESLGDVLLNALPLAVTLGGAAVFGLLFDVFFPKLSGQTVFSFSLALGIGTAFWQERGAASIPLRRLAFNRSIARMLLLLLALFVFKDTIRVAGLVDAFSHIGTGFLVIVSAFIILPVLSGILTGVMVGFVGMCFPILIGILQAAPALQAYMAPLIVLATVAGNCGQMLSPVHVCLVVTGEYFGTNLADMWRRLMAPVGMFLLGGGMWALCLYFFDARF
jgi:integral membrane protein (TIGR00529 family)